MRSSGAGEAALWSRSVTLWRRASALRLSSVGFDKSLRKTHRLGISERLIEVRERVGLRADRAPRNRVVMPLEDAQRAHEMRHLAAPAAANLEMLAVGLLVHVDRARAGVGVVAGDHVTAAVADQVERLFDGARRAGRFDGHVDTDAAGQRPHDLQALRRRGALDVDDV